MALLSQIKELPTRYHVLHTIRSVELKVTLAERISEVIKLLSFFHNIELTPKSQTLVQGFFDYLHHSCEYPNITVDKRAQWLLQYANVVRDHLLVVKGGVIDIPHHVKAGSDNKLIDNVADLIELIADNHFQHLSDPCEGICDRLSHMIDLAVMIVPRPYELSHIEVSAALLDLMVRLTQLSTTKTCLSSPFDDWLIGSLIKIIHLMNNIVLLQRK